MATKTSTVDLETQIPSFEKIIRDSELLLSYAAATGKTLDGTDVRMLYDAIRKFSTDNSLDQDFDDVILAYGRLSKSFLPITVDSLRQESAVTVRRHSQRSIRSYIRWILGFAALVIVTSLLSFVSSAISESIKTEIDLANSKTITLRAHFAPAGQQSSPDQPANAANSAQSTYSVQDRLIDLQQLAISTRSIYGRSQQLRWLIVPALPDPFINIRGTKEMHAAFELDATKPDIDNFNHIVNTYQEVRAYAQSLRDAVAFWYGGIAAGVLPVFYALLGVCARSLRRIQIELLTGRFFGELRAGMFVGFSAQALVAVVVGTAISLFSARLGSGSSLTPLACAFLAGYLVEPLVRPSDTEEELLKEGSSPNKDGLAPIILGLGILTFGAGVGGMIWSTMNGGGAILSYAGVMAIGAVAASLSLLSGRRTDGEGQEAGQQWSPIVFNEDVRSAGRNGIPSPRS